MITLENRFFPVRSAICFFVEGGIILASVLASFAILQGKGSIEVVNLQDAVVRGLIVAFVCQSCMYFLDMYDLKISKSWGELFFSVIFAVGIVCIGIGLISVVIPEIGVEGTMYYLTILFAAFLLLLWRVGFDFYLKRIAPAQNILVVGTGEAARLVGAEIRDREGLGFRLVGYVGNPPGGGRDADGAPPVLGGYDEIGDLLSKNKVEKVVVAIEERRGIYPVADMLAARVAGHQIVEWPKFFEMLAGRIPVDNLAPSFFIFSEGFRKSATVLAIRRILSFAAAAILLAVVAPVLLLVGALIKLDSPGPVFYSQTRVGQHGRLFRILKFRSMRQDAERNGGPRWAIENDPRITRVGRLIRAMRIDEFPQLLNVLRGDLDLVGPRPERPVFVEELQKRIPFYSLRHTVKPGLTGWAQVMFTYCGTIEESKEKLQYDLFYIKNMSIKLDLLILFRTLKIVLLGRGAR